MPLTVVDPRRSSALLAELRRLVPAFLPGWQAAGGEDDAARALLTAAAALSEEVTRRLDRVPEKAFRNLLDWLAVQRDPARPARLVVVLRPVEGALAAVPVPARQRLQAPGGNEPVVFETLAPLRMLPGRLVALVATNGADDRFWTAPPALVEPTPPQSTPVARTAAAAAAAGQAQLQVTPALGLEAGQPIGVGGVEYRLAAITEDIVTLDRPLDAAVAQGDAVLPVTVFAPFGRSGSGDPDFVAAYDRQEHVLHIGDGDLLRIEGAAKIAVAGGAGLLPVAWAYWGKREGQAAGEPGWVPLDPPALNAGGRLVLAKPKGMLEEMELAGRKARWLRARWDRANQGLPAGTALDGLALAVSAGPPETQRAAAPASVGPATEALANSVPVPTNVPFFPFGQEPRLFDTFALGCPEAFSKPGADVSLWFSLADASIGALVPAWPLPSDAPPGPAVTRAYGIGGDGVLYAAELPGFGPRLMAAALGRRVARRRVGTPVAGEGGDPASAGRPVRLEVGVRPAVREITGWRRVACLGSDDAVWVMSERGGEDPSWDSLGLPPNGDPPAPVAALAFGGRSQRWLVAACGRQLHRREADVAGSEWEPLGDPLTKEEGAVALLVTARPVSAVGGGPEAATLAPVVAVTAAGFVVLVDAEKAKPHIRIAENASTEVVPVALCTPDGDVLVVATNSERGVVFAVRHLPGGGQHALHALTAGVASGGLELLPTRAPLQPVVLFRAKAEAGEPDRLGAWLAGAPKALDLGAGAETGPAGGPPVALAGAVVVPGAERNLFWRPWRGGPRTIQLPVGSLRTGVRIGAGDVPKLPGVKPANLPARLRIECQPDGAPSQRGLQPVEAIIPAGQDDAVYRPAGPLPEGDKAAWRLYVLPATRAKSTVDAQGRLDVTTDPPARDAVLLLGPDASTLRRFTVAEVEDVQGPQGNALKLARFAEPDQPQAGETQWCAVLRSIKGNAWPTLDLEGIADTDRTALAQGAVVTAEPSDVALEPLTTGARYAAFRAAWLVPPLVERGLGLALTVAEPPDVDVWTQETATDPAVNPTLSWEYWNSTGWWRLEVSDGTRDLRQSGELQFRVPADLAPTEVAGRASHWIRARLIAGDYGREVWQVRSDPDPKDPENPNKSIQTSERDLSLVHAPNVLNLAVAYDLDTAQPPREVLTLDNGAWRDQGEANRLAVAGGAGGAPGATVAAFTPLATTLGPFGPDADAGKARALWIGIASSAPVQGGSVRLLAVVEERAVGVRLVAEALRGTAFVPLALQDGTDGLAQTGLLTLAIDAPPSLVALFGVEAFWLRLRPEPGAAGADAWQPALRGLYLNAVETEAAETQELEVLGASAGGPGQVVTLARPPVLPDSLELRVREPIGPEQVAALRKAGGADAVKEDPRDRPGLWVLWRQEADPADWGPADRVYALDPANGEIRFGDGRAGMVPPPGRDAIAAFAYRRSAGAASNLVKAWDQLQPATPIEGVEAALAPLAAAGGSDAATAAQTIARAPDRLRHRGAAVTGADLAAMALAATPALVQARWLGGRPPVLVVVQAGEDPRPGRELRRALQRTLLEAAPPRLGDAGGTQGALVIAAPRLRWLRLHLRLEVDDLDIAGALAEQAGAALRGLLDPGTGGVGGGGWPVGAVPGEAELMAVLAGLPGLVAVNSIAAEDADAGVAFPARVAADELVLLAADGLRLGFAVAGAP